MNIRHQSSHWVMGDGGFRDNGLTLYTKNLTIE